MSSCMFDTLFATGSWTWWRTHFI